MFKELGFSISKYTLVDIIPNQTFIDEIVKFNTDSANILKFSPSFFIMPSHLKGSSEEKIAKAKKQISFIKLLTTLEIKLEELEVYKNHYGYQNIILLYLNSQKNLIVVDKLSNVSILERKDNGIIDFTNKDSTKLFLDMALDSSKEEINDIISKYTKLIFN